VAAGVSATGRLASLTGSTPDGYRRHALHAATRAYAESNCYTDVVIELLHARGLEPLAMFGHLVRMDFEGDQWTFFKPPPEDLERLFGVDIHEMQPYRPLPRQIAEQLTGGRTIIVELDSWYLPDTEGTSYRAEHVKSSVAAESIDPAGETLRYYHGPGLFELSGPDYRGVFGLDDRRRSTLPPYTELVRFDAGAPLLGPALRDAARELLACHLVRRPAENPFRAFGVHLEGQLSELLAGDLDDYHHYAFATVRMAGAAFEILGDHATWLFDDQATDVTDAATEIVEGCKALSFRMARRRPFDPTERISALAAAWERMLDGLARRAC
jgi:Domain of unknown function (DUF1839)